MNASAMIRVIASRSTLCNDASKCVSKNISRTYKYQTTKERQMLYKQQQHPKFTQQVMIQRKEVANYDGFKMIEPLIDQTKEPHKLHLIKKIRSIRGEPWWVKNAMNKLGFDQKKEWIKTYSIRPNTLDVNNWLWLCKHMVKITPINMDDGEPTMEDIKFSNLNLQSGKLSIIREIKKIQIDNIEYETVNGIPIANDEKKSFILDRKEIQRYLNRKRELQQLNAEYFPTVYEYKHDQDKPGVVRIKGTAHTSIIQDE